MCVSLGQTPHLDTQKLSEPTLRPHYDSGTPFLRTLSLSSPLAATTVSTDHPLLPISLPCRPCIILPPPPHAVPLSGLWVLLGPWLHLVIAFNCRRNFLSLKFSAVGGGRVLQLGTFVRPQGHGADLLVGTQQLSTLEVWHLV